VDKDGFVFVADTNNQRVISLSPALTFVREFLMPVQFKWRPRRLWLDSDRRRLYVADSDSDTDSRSRRRVLVVSV